MRICLNLKEREKSELVCVTVGRAWRVSQSVSEWEGATCPVHGVGVRLATVVRGQAEAELEGHHEDGPQHAAQ